MRYVNDKKREEGQNVDRKAKEWHCSVTVWLHIKTHMVFPWYVADGTTINVRCMAASSGKFFFFFGYVCINYVRLFSPSEATTGIPRVVKME